MFSIANAQTTNISTRIHGNVSLAQLATAKGVMMGQPPALCVEKVTII